MHREIDRLILYGGNEGDKLLSGMGELFRKIEEGSQSRHTLRTMAYAQIRHLLDLATDFGFDGNLWHNYLAFYMIEHENPFSITCERRGASDGSVNAFALHDFEAIRTLFFYDFSEIEKHLSFSCFSQISDYRAIPKKEMMYNKNASERVQALSKMLEESADAEGFFAAVTGFYRDYGVGTFGLNKAFRARGKAGEEPEFVPINNLEQVTLSDLLGYEVQKRALVENTYAFVEGRGGNNCLLFGESGTGKSSSVKAIANEFYKRGLRMIELHRHQFKDLSGVISVVKKRNYKFIIYLDDLSFEEFETDYKFLKAVIEGGVETKPDNILIYATSNRRHLVSESWDDRRDVQQENGLHRSDTMQEKLSLSQRFGLSIYYGKPSRDEYHDIVLSLAKREGICMPREELIDLADKWELKNGGISGRTARQLINDLLGRQRGQ